MPTQNPKRHCGTVEHVQRFAYIFQRVHLRHVVISRRSFVVCEMHELAYELCVQNPCTTQNGRDVFTSVCNMRARAIFALLILRYKPCHVFTMPMGTWACKMHT